MNSPLDLDIEDFGVLAEDYQEMLLESLDGSSMASMAPALSDKWTESRQYYAVATGKGSNIEFFLVRLENRWHEGGTRIGKNSKSVTIHPLDVTKTTGSIHKQVKRIKYPLGLIYGVIEAIQASYYEHIAEGFILFLDAKVARYAKVIKRIYQKSSVLKGKFDLEINKIGGEKVSGVMVSLCIAYKSPEEVFSNMFAKYKKLGLNVSSLSDLTSLEEFSDDAAKQVKTAMQKSVSLKIDMKNFFMSGVETSYNKDLRNRAPLEPRRNAKFEENNIRLAKDYIEELIDRESKREVITESRRKAIIAEGYSDLLKPQTMNFSKMATPDLAKDPKSITALKKFTGSDFTMSRRVMLGDYDEENSYDMKDIKSGRTLVKDLDRVFDKHAHNIAHYDGYVYRGVDMANLYGLLKEMITEKNHALPGHTSFTYRYMTARSFGNFNKWYLDAVIDDNFLPGGMGEVVLDLTVNGNELGKLWDAVSALFTEDAFENKYQNITKLEAGQHGIIDCKMLMYSLGGHDKVSVVIPGMFSSYETERELIVDRSTVLKAEKVRVIVNHYGEVGGVKPCEIHLLWGFTFDSKASIINENKVMKGFKELMMNEATKKPVTKPSKQKVTKDKEPKYTEEQLKDLKQKFGSNPF